MKVQTDGQEGAAEAVATPSANYHRTHDSIETINTRIAARLGIDFLKEAETDKRTRYLQRVCGHLPPVYSTERDEVRNGISLQKWAELQEEQEQGKPANGK